MKSLHKAQEEIIPAAERKLSILEGQVENLEGREVRSSLQKVTGIQKSVLRKTEIFLKRFQLKNVNNL